MPGRRAARGHAGRARPTARTTGPTERDRRRRAPPALGRLSCHRSPTTSAACRHAGALPASALPADRRSRRAADAHLACAARLALETGARRQGRLDTVKRPWSSGSGPHTGCRSHPTSGRALARRAREGGEIGHLARQRQLDRLEPPSSPTAPSVNRAPSGGSRITVADGSRAIPPGSIVRQVPPRVPVAHRHERLGGDAARRGSPGRAAGAARASRRGPRSAPWCRARPRRLAAGR